MPHRGQAPPYTRPGLLDELNVEQYELTKIGSITLTHASGTHNDRFWALTLAAYTAQQNEPHHTPRSKTA